MTAIEWTDETWNPTVGCSKVSPGCDDCYAIRVAARQMSETHVGLTTKGERGLDWTGEVRCLPERLDAPLRWRKPRRVFVDSMSDLFHPDVPLDFILQVWSVMSQCPQHTFQILTKRPQRMAKIVSAIAWDWEGDDKGGEAYAWPGHHIAEDHNTGEIHDWWPTEDDLDGGGEMPLPNVWLGTSIESNRYAFRADHLRATPAAVRFVSAEPLLGPLDALDLTGIDWLIVGGESGPGARPMHPEWVRDLRDRCSPSSVDSHSRSTCPSFFFKQWGEWVPHGVGIVRAQPTHYLLNDGRVKRDTERLGSEHLLHPVLVARTGKKAAGRELDGRTWDEVPA